jgi:predicted small integral membrane protein
MIETRLVKIVMVVGLALFALLVCLNNLIDYGSNFAFVQHVLSMDTTFPGNGLRGRAISDPTLHHVGYWLIILGEGLTGLLFAAATVMLVRALRAPAAAFHRAKRLAMLGAALGFTVWFTGFMVIGGEWFAMWQSPTWNGQEAAFRFYVTILLVLIFVSLRDDELPARSDV